MGLNSSGQVKAELVKKEILARMGTVPGFFRVAEGTPVILEDLWRQAQTAYLDNPLPSLLKEKVLAYLSRFCDVPYCLVWHSVFLMGRGDVAEDLKTAGLTVDELLQLLSIPLPSDEELADHLAFLADIAGPIDLQAMSTEQERSLLVCCTPIFLRDRPGFVLPRESGGFAPRCGLVEECQDQVRTLLGGSEFEWLLTLLSFLRTAHFWTETHPQIAIDDVAIEMLVDCPSIAAWVESYRSQVNSEFAERARVTSERQFRALADAMPVSIGIAVDGRRVYVNRHAETVTGYSIEELIGRKVGSLADPGVMQALSGSSQEGNRIQRFDFEIQRKDGEKRWVECSTTPFTWLGQPAVLDASVDITERRRAELALRESEARHVDLYENAPDMMLSVEVPTGIVIQCNRALTKVLGRSKEEILGNSVLGLYSRESAERVRIELIPRFRCLGQLTDEGLTIQCADGSTREVTLNATAVRDEVGQVLVSRSILRDVTDQARTQAALQRSETNFRQLTRELPAAVSITWDGRQVFANRFVKDLTGYSPLEFMNLAPGQLVHPDSRERHKQLRDECREHGTPARNELRITRKDGQDRWLDYSVSQIEYDGQPAQLSISIDITDRKKVEQSLRLKDQAIQSAVMGVVFTDLDGRLTDCNPAFLRMWRAESINELLGRSVTELGTDSAVVEEILNSIRQFGHWDGEDLARRCDGTSMPIQFVASLIQDEHGRPHGLMATIRDITVQKQAEAILRKSGEQFRALAESLPAMVVVIHGRARLYVNQMAEQLTGYSREELLASDISSLVHPDDHERVMDRSRRRQSGEDVKARYEFRIVTKSGDIRWIDMSVVMTTYEGLPVVLATSIDITDKVHAALELHAREEQLRLALAAGDMSVFDMNFVTGIKSWSDSMGPVFGMPYGSEPSQGDTILDWIHPEDRDEEQSRFEQAVNSGGTYHNEFRVFWPDRSLHWIERTGQVLKDGSGELQRIIGVARETTARHQAQQAIHESENLFRCAFEDAATPSALQDPDGRYLRVNSAFCQMVGRSPEELIGLSWRDITHKEDHSNYAEFDFENLDRTVEHQHRRQKRYVHKDERIVWVLVSVSLVRNIDGQPLYRVVQAQNITEQREAETKLSEFQNEVASIARLNTIAEMAAGICHELSQPLSAIANYSAVCLRLLSNPASEKEKNVRGHIESIQKISHEAGQILRHMRNFGQRRESPAIRSDLQ